MFQTTNQFPIEVYHGDLILWMIVVQEIREHQSSSWKEVHPDMRIRKTKTMGPHSSKLTLLSIPEVGIVTIVP